MTRSRSTPLAVAAATAAAALLVSSAGAKFRLSVAVDPARPAAREPARVILRSDVVLAREHVRLFVVGPWRQNIGQASFEVRLARTAPRELRGRVRFPHPGLWHLRVSTSPPTDRRVRVRRAP